MAVPNSERIVAVAREAIGMSEHPVGSNDGPELRAFMKEVGFVPGEPWCLWFARAVVYKAYAGEAVPEIVALDTGLCQELLDVAREKDCITRYVSTGSIFLLLNSQGHAFHAGICVGPGAQIGTIASIEGNTNDNGSAEGYEVCRHVRPIHACRFLGW